MNRDDLRTAVLLDIDSTLAYTQHRWHLSPMADPSSSWGVFCAARMDDTPIPGPVTAARLHYRHHQVHLCSGSEDSAEDVTRKWLDLYRVPYDGLRLRAAGDERPNADLKVACILELRGRGIETVLAYEDHPQVAAEVYERTRVPVVCVNPCYPEDLEKFRTQAFDGMGGGL